MRNIVKDLRFMIRDAWASRGSGKAEYDSGVARVLRESSHVRGGRGGMARASTEAQQKIAMEGKDQYAKSFEDPDEIQK